MINIDTGYRNFGGFRGFQFLDPPEPMYCLQTGESNNRNARKFTKSSVYINQIPPSAKKSTYMKRNYLNPT